MNVPQHEFDVVVLGGAFAGSATALLLRREQPDLRVVMIDKEESFDRKVGESSVELSAWFMTQKLGITKHLVFDQLPKYGLRFWFQNERVGRSADASELGNKFQTRVPGFHIDRARLDEYVHAQAREAGVEVWRPGRASAIEHEPGRGCSLRVDFPDGSARTISARWLVDASGRKATMARKLGLLEPLRVHPTHSVWARYRGIADFDGSWASPHDGRMQPVWCPRGLATNHLAGLGWWVWVIPLPGGDVSVGVVYDERLVTLPEGPDLGTRLDAFLRSTPLGAEMLADATRVPGDIKALVGLPYRCKEVAGDGWVAVGDAAGFLDPFYSPGLDWGSITICAAIELIAAQRRGEDVATRSAELNRKAVRSIERWFEALYRDKYYYLGDFDLMSVALRMDVAFYYLGVIGPPYRGGQKELEFPFAPPISEPFFRMMRLVNSRLTSIAKARIAAGTWGRNNDRHRCLLMGFTPGPKMIKHAPGIAWSLLKLELGALPDRWRAWRGLTPQLASQAVAGTPSK